MGNLTKNLLLALTLVCVIALIVFFVQLIVLNRGVEPREPGATISADSQQEDEQEDPDSEATGDETPDADETGDDNEPAQITTRPPPQGTQHELLVAADTDTKLIVYAKDDLFDFVENETNWEFLYSGEGDAALEIGFMFVSPRGLAADAETYLSNYTDGAATEFEGEQPIQDSGLRGYHLSAQRGNTSYEAWIHALPDSDLALVFVISYINSQQRDALYEILSSMEVA